MILRTATAFRSRTPGVVNRFNKKSAKQVYNGRVNKLNVFVVSFFFSIVDSSINREPNEMFADRHPKWATQWKVPTSYPQNQSRVDTYCFTQFTKHITNDSALYWSVVITVPVRLLTKRCCTTRRRLVLISFQKTKQNNYPLK